MEKTAVDNAAGRAAALDVYDFKGGRHEEIIH